MPRNIPPSAPPQISRSEIVRRGLRPRKSGRNVQNEAQNFKQNLKDPTSSKPSSESPQRGLRQASDTKSYRPPTERTPDTASQSHIEQSPKHGPTGSPSPDRRQQVPHATSQPQRQTHGTPKASQPPPPSTTSTPQRGQTAELAARPQAAHTPTAATDMPKETPISDRPKSPDSAPTRSSAPRTPRPVSDTPKSPDSAPTRSSAPRTPRPMAPQQSKDFTATTQLAGEVPRQAPKQAPKQAADQAPGQPLAQASQTSAQTPSGQAQTQARTQAQTQAPEPILERTLEETAGQVRQQAGEQVTARAPAQVPRQAAEQVAGQAGAIAAAQSAQPSGAPSSVSEVSNVPPSDATDVTTLAQHISDRLELGQTQTGEKFMRMELKGDAFGEGTTLTMHFAPNKQLRLVFSGAQAQTAQAHVPQLEAALGAHTSVAVQIDVIPAGVDPGTFVSDVGAQADTTAQMTAAHTDPDEQQRQQPHGEQADEDETDR